MNHTEFLTEGWRDQSADPRLVDRVLRNLNQRERSQRKWFIALGFLATGGGAAATSAFFLFGATPLTLAQVIEAGSKVKSFTETNRRIMGPEKGGGFSIIKRVSDDAAFSEVKNFTASYNDGSFSYADSQQKIQYFGHEKLALVDGPGPKWEVIDQIPKMTAFLKDFKASKVEKDFDWNGRKVTRFTFRNKVHDYDIDQELLADPQTHLPLKFTSMRDNHSWGDEWLFDYSPVDKASLKPTMPRGAKVVDLRPQRQKLLAILSNPKSDVPTWLSSSLYETILIVKKTAKVSNNFMSFEADVTSALTGKTLHFKRLTGPMEDRNLRVGPIEYWQFNLRWDMDKRENAFASNDKLSGWITIGLGKDQVKKVTFNNVEATQVGYADFVVEPIKVPFVRPKLGWQKPTK